MKLEVWVRPGRGPRFLHETSMDVRPWAGQSRQNILIPPFGHSATTLAPFESEYE
jgi:hypothetical protein